MNEVEKFFAEEIKPLWPNWEPTKTELESWIEKLKKCNLYKTRQRLKEWLESQEDIGKKPSIGRFIKQKIIVFDKAVSNIPELPYCYLRCVQAPPNHPDWEDRQWIVFVPTSLTGKEIEYLEQKAKEWEQKEGGRWRPIISAESLEENPLWGNEAKKEAENRILNGPNTAGRRFLLSIGRIGSVQEMASKAFENPDYDPEYVPPNDDIPF